MCAPRTRWVSIVRWSVPGCAEGAAAEGSDRRRGRPRVASVAPGAAADAAGDCAGDCAAACAAACAACAPAVARTAAVTSPCSASNLATNLSSSRPSGRVASALSRSKMGSRFSGEAPLSHARCSSAVSESEPNRRRSCSAAPRVPPLETSPLRRHYPVGQGNVVPPLLRCCLLRHFVVRVGCGIRGGGSRRMQPPSRRSRRPRGRCPRAAAAAARWTP